MPYKKINCILAEGDADVAALKTAFAMARGAEGHVAALHIRPDPREAVPMLGEGVSGTLVQEIMASAERENRTRADRAHAVFEQARLEAGAALCATAPGPGGVTADWVSVTGQPEERAAAAAALADLTVFPHLGDEAETGAVLMFEAALMASGRPLLLAPRTAPSAVGHHVVVAWNGSTQAARAVGFALPVIARSDRVTVLTAQTGKTEGGKGADLAAYLAWHGVRAQSRTVQPGGGESVGAALLRTVGEVGGDLMVMGGYGTSRLREMILGGVTRHVLNSAVCPVLMAH